MSTWTAAHTLALIYALVGLCSIWWERWRDNRRAERERFRLYKGWLP